MVAQALVVISAAIVLLLGSLHLIYTFFGSKLRPRDPTLQARMPRSHVDLPEGLWPPHLTARSRFDARANCTALLTSDAPRGCTISAGRLSICKFRTRRASS